MTSVSKFIVFSEATVIDNEVFASCVHVVVTVDASFYIIPGTLIFGRDLYAIEFSVGAVRDNVAAFISFVVFVAAVNASRV